MKPLAYTVWCLGPLLTAGCRADRCVGEPPAFQLDIQLGAGVPIQAVTRLQVTVTAAGLTRHQTLPVAGLLDDGETSALVKVGPAGAGGFTATVDVSALDGSNTVLAHARDDFVGSGDACNFFSITLGTGVDGGADGPPFDRGPPVDGPNPRETSPPPDGKPPSDTKPPPDAKPPPDTKPPPDANPLPDVAPPPDAYSPVDAKPPCTVLSEVNPNAVTCSQQCVSPTNDLDCDGLPDVRDPWATSCNTLTLAEEFQVSPVGSSTWTTPSGAGWSCGHAELGAGQSLKLADLTPLAPTRFLVEAKLTLGAIVNVNNWSVRIQSVPATGSGTFVCELWLNQSYQPTPGLHAMAFACVGTWTAGTNYPAAPGTTYFLQSYYTSSAMVCRLLSDSGLLIASKSISSTCTTNPQPSKALTVVANGRAATVHHVRVFEAP